MPSPNAETKRGECSVTIERSIKLGGLAIQLGMVVAIAISGYEFETVRFGGPIHHQNQLVSDLIGDILPPPEYVLEAYMETTKLIEHPESLPQRRARLAELEAQFNDREQYWRGSDLDPKLQQIMQQDAAPAAHLFWADVDQGLLPALDRHDMPAAEAAYAQIEQHYQTHRHGIDELVSASNDLQASIATSTQKSVRAAEAIILLLVAGLFVAVTLGLRYIKRATLDPLRIIIDALKRLAAGDTATRIATPRKDDELGELTGVFLDFRAQLEAAGIDRDRQTELIVTTIGAGLARLSQGDLTVRIDQNLQGPFAQLEEDFNAALAALQATLGQVALATDNVSAGTRAIHQSSDNLAERTQRQSVAIAQTTLAVRDITTTTDETAASASHAREIVVQTQSEAAQSGEVLNRTIAAMGDIEHASAEIVDIISVIDGIAFQTNLLALNAGVEAARAGDAGKGFAVVANEVRALAQRSADAARDIKNRITASGEMVSSGVGLVGETGEALKRISARVGEISAIIDTIASGTLNQATALRQVDSAMREMDAVTRENARMVEDGTQSIRHLAAEASRLRDHIGEFRIELAAETAPPARARCAA